jgi:hypothetical protein
MVKQSTVSQQTNRQIENLAEKRKRSIIVRILAVVVAISGFVFMLTAILFFAGSTALVFLVADFGVLPLPYAVTGIVVFGVGLILMYVGVGIWRLRLWGWVLGLAVSVFLIAVSVLNLDFVSFSFIRGVIVTAYLLGIRDQFLNPQTWAYKNSKGQS